MMQTPFHSPKLILIFVNRRSALRMAEMGMARISQMGRWKLDTWAGLPDSCYDAACGNYSVARSSGTGEEGALKRVCVRFFSASVIKNTPRIAISGSIG